jgi:hypothetical protein
VLDFAITKTHLFATTTDSRLSIYKFRKHEHDFNKEDLVGDFLLEGVGIAVSVLEYTSESRYYPNKSKYDTEEYMDDDEIENRAGRDYTLIAVGFVTSFTIYRLDYRLNTLTHVGSRVLPNPTAGRIS